MELMVSIGILATAILLIVGVFTFLFSSSQKSRDLTAGAIAAESFLQEWIEGYMSDADTWSGILRDLGKKSGKFTVKTSTSSMNHTNFTYSIYSENLNSLLGTDKPLIKLTIVCQWWDNNSALPGVTRQGYGQLSVELSRLIYDGDY